VAVLVTVEVKLSGMGGVSVTVEVADGGKVAVNVAVGRFVGVLLGTQPPCIKIPEMLSEFVVDKVLSCRREAFTALKDRQVNGINKPIKSASNASKISAFCFLFLFFSIPTSLGEQPTTRKTGLFSTFLLQVMCPREYASQATSTQKRW
jgi:hypothetical protein